AGTRALMDPLTVVLDDCDGKAAEALMAHPDPITQRAPGSALARAVVETDAIVLLVDAASTRTELEEAFEEFDHFLTVVERAKTDARTVGGFPVYLVLTQCDRLAQPGDTLEAWEARVTDRVRYADDQFKEYLREAVADGAPAAYLGFGSVDLDVFAVAIRRPPLSEHPAPGDQPYQVAELFRDCFAAARAHHDRARRSERRLKWTVRIALAAVAFLSLVLGTIGLFPPEAAAPDLAAKIDDYERHERPAAERLADARREHNREALRRFAGDGAFPGLSDNRRTFVESRLKEIADYDTYRAKLASATAPAAARSRPELGRVRERLRTDLALPTEYSWGETAAAELRDKWIKDCDAIEPAQQRFVDAYRALDHTALALLVKRTFDDSWLKDVDAIAAAADRPQFDLSEPLPGSPAINQPRGEAVTNRVPYEFDEVYQARRYLEQSRDRVLHLRDLADALGLTAGPNRPPAALAIPGPDGADSAALPTKHLSLLGDNYRRQTAGYPEWAVVNFLDPARGALAARLRASSAAGAEHVHRLLTVKDTVEGWSAVGAALADPRFTDWARLLFLLARLQDPNATNPVADLATFLRDLDKKTLYLDLKSYELAIPLDLTFDRVEPAGPFAITVTRANQTSDTAKFTVGKGAVRGTATAYPLAPDGNTKLAYRPGDTLRAELPVKAGTRDLKLVWETGPTKTFQFDRLAQEPRLTKPADGTEPAPGVRLSLTAGSVPKFPALMPLPK
ncbi:MAG: hypothetical protein ACKODX_03710, partial [Gemmata sp.]